MVSVQYLVIVNAIKTLIISVISSKSLYLGLSGVYYTFAQVDDSLPRFFDIPPRTEYYKAYAKENFTFRCPGANENTLVEYLEWHSESKHKKVLEFQKDAGITYYHEWKARVTMDKDYGLIFSNVTSSDSGDYICLINHRLLPDVMLRFTVIDVPDPPGRPLITFFSSRSANLSWAAPKGTNQSQITHYTVIIRPPMTDAMRLVYSRYDCMKASIKVQAWLEANFQENQNGGPVLVPQKRQWIQPQ